MKNTLRFPDLESDCGKLPNAERCERIRKNDMSLNFRRMEIPNRARAASFRVGVGSGAGGKGGGGEGGS